MNTISRSIQLSTPFLFTLIDKPQLKYFSWKMSVKLKNFIRKDQQYLTTTFKESKRRRMYSEQNPLVQNRSIQSIVTIA